MAFRGVSRLVPKSHVHNMLPSSGKDNLMKFEKMSFRQLFILS